MPADEAPSTTVTLRSRDPDALARQAEYRCRYKSQDEMCGTGGRPGSWRGLTRTNKVLVVCGEADCAALGAYARVLRDACGDNRSEIAPRDGSLPEDEWSV